MIKSEKIKYFDYISSEREKWRKKSAYYHKELENYIKFLVSPYASILEIGCGTGDLLNSLNPKRGVGIDISPRMVEQARIKFPNLEFKVDDLEKLQIEEKFDYVIVVDTIGHVNDVQMAFRELIKVCKPETRLIVVYYNYLWEPIIKFAEAVGLKMKQPLQHWLSMEDITNLLYLNNFEVLKKRYRFLLPKYVPILSNFFNKILANLPFFGGCL